MIPKIFNPIIDIEQPSTKKKLNFTRYTVKQEKILLMAKESKKITDIFKAIKQVVAGCCQEPDFDIDQVPLFDLEYFYLKLRAHSVRNVESFKVTDREDEKEYLIGVNFDEISVDFKEAKDKFLKVDDNITIQMRYPMSTIYDEEDIEARLLKEGIFELVVSCIEKVYNNDEPLILSNKEMKEFVDSLDMKTFLKIEDFLINVPNIHYECDYTNSLGHQRKITFSSLNDFFMYL